MSEDRIQKILARAGVASRRGSEELIEAGRVTVNGTRATLGDKADTDHDAIKVDGKRIHPRTDFHYLLLNKPRAVMSTRHDPEGRPTVMDYVPPGRRKAMVPVGRLDFLTEGLILLTDDGDLAHRVAHPRYGCTKTYEAKVRGTPEPRALDRLRQGLPIEGKRTAPAVIEARPVPGESDNSWWTVELSEGRTRQIREMFKRIGHPVMKLRRVAIGPLRDANLPLGAVRELSDAEVEALRKSTRGGGTAVVGAKKAARQAGGDKPRRRTAEGSRAAARRKGSGKKKASPPRKSGRVRKPSADSASVGTAGAETAGAETAGSGRGSSGRGSVGLGHVGRGNRGRREAWHRRQPDRHLRTQGRGHGGRWRRG